VIKAKLSINYFGWSKYYDKVLWNVNSSSSSASKMCLKDTGITNNCILTARNLISSTLFIHQKKTAKKTKQEKENR